MESFKQFAAPEAAGESEKKQMPKAGKFMRALHIALATIGGGSAVEAAHQTAEIVPFDEEKLKDVEITGPEAQALNEFWSDSKEEILSTVMSGSPEEQEIGKQLIENMGQAVEKVEQIAVLHETFEKTKEDLNAILENMTSQKKQLEEYGIVFEVSE